MTALGQLQEQNLWPFFASSLHQTGAAIRARISATPAQTRNVGSGIHLPSAPRNPGARDSSCLFIAHLLNRGQGSLISFLKPVAASAPALVHSPPLHRRSLPNGPAENGCILANGER